MRGETGPPCDIPHLTKEVGACGRSTPSGASGWSSYLCSSFAPPPKLLHRFCRGPFAANSGHGFRNSSNFGRCTRFEKLLGCSRAGGRLRSRASVGDWPPDPRRQLHDRQLRRHSSSDSGLQVSSLTAFGFPRTLFVGLRPPPPVGVSALGGRGNSRTQRRSRSWN